MKRIILVLTSIFALLAFNINAQLATCDSDIEVGQNLIVNGSFESGDVDFNVPGYASWNEGNGLQQNRPDYWSSKGEYYVINDSYLFNLAFKGQAHTGSGMLAVDGLCDIGNVVWEQEVSIEANTNYYFSAWISSIHQDSTAKLSFEIAGEELPEKIIAPKGVDSLGVWVNYVDSSWYSGSNSGVITLRIKNSRENGCDNGNDFALDDISFSPGCFFGGEGQVPDFGAEEFTLCGLSDGILTLEAEQDLGVNYVYKWTDASGGGTTNTLEVDKPGTYALCMTTNGSCTRYKEVTVTNDFSVSLGDDIDLCSPATTTLVPDYFKGEKYDWFKDGEALGQFKNQQSATVNEVGTYKLVVTDANASCGQREDEVIVSSSTIRAVNGYFCPDDALAVDLSITNMLSDAANYKWYSDEALTTEVATGGTFTTPNNLTETTTYWVKDESKQELVAGIPSVKYTSSGYAKSDANDYIEFTVLNDFVLDSITIYPIFWNPGTSGYGLKILDVDNSLNFLTNILVNYTTTSAIQTPTTPFKFAVDYEFVKGKTYQIRKEGPGLQWISSTEWVSSDNLQPDIMQISKLNPTWETLGFYDWDITAGSPCDPIEVKAIYDPVKCSECETPTDVTVNVTGTLPIKCPSDDVTLTANVVGGVGTWEYQWLKNGVEVLGANAATYVVDKDLADKYTVEVTEELEPEVCFFTSEATEVTTEEVEETSVTLNTDLGESQCLVGGVTATASAVNITDPVYSWTVNAVGDQSQDLNSLTLNVVDRDIVEVTVTGTDECGDPVTEVANATIIGETEITPTVAINGTDGLCADVEASLTATITPENLTNVTYDWAVTGGKTSTDPVYSIVLNDGDVVELTVTFNGNECLTSNTASAQVNAEVSNSPDPSVGINVKENNLCADDLPMLFEVVSAIGEGITPTFEWFVGNDLKGTGTEFSFDVEDGDLVSVVMTSSDACATSPTATSTSIEANVNPMVDASVSISGDDGQCSGNDVTLSASVTPEGTAGTFVWSVDGDVKSETSDTYVSSLYIGEESVNVSFKPSVQCPVNEEVSSSSYTVSFEDPSVSLESLYEGDLCSGKDNGYKAINETLTGTNPTYSWTINEDPTVLSTDDFIERNDFKTGDTVKLLVTPDPSLNCPDAYALAVLGEFQEEVSISLNIADSAMCAGSSLVLQADTKNGGFTPKFQWYKNDVAMENDTLSSITVNGNEGDDYKVVFESSLYCIDDTLATDSITLHLVEVPVAEAGPSIALEDYIETILDGNGSTLGNVDYVWTTEEVSLYESMIGRETIKTTVTPVEKFTKFYLTVTNTEEGITCSAKDSTDVTVSFDFPIPNAFSPNGDGANDVFEIDNLDKLDSFTLQIYNRWGSLLYEQKSATEFWDGKKGGSPVPASTYFYLFTYELDGETTTEDGYISLIR